MPRPSNRQLRVADPNNILGPYMALYEQHLSAGRYCPRHGRRSRACILHFGDWLRLTGLEPSTIDEKNIGRFLYDHLPACSCGFAVPRDRNLNRAALNALLRLLRSNGVAAAGNKLKLASGSDQDVSRAVDEITTSWGKGCILDLLSFWFAYKLCALLALEDAYAGRRRMNKGSLRRSQRPKAAMLLSTIRYPL